MNVLLTGGAGFIGSHVTERLAARGDSVTILDDFNDYYSPALKRANAEAALAAGDVVLEEGDIRDAELVERVFDGGGFDCVLHLAARAGVRPSLADPKLYVDVNLNGTLNLLEAARRFGVERFIFASSSSVYGSLTTAPFSEDAPADRPSSPYGATKRGGELLCATYHHLYDLRCTALRFFTVYGPRQRPDMAIHKFTRAVLAGETLSIYGDGTSARDYTYVDDVVDGVQACADADHDWEIINLGSSRPVELSQMVEVISKATGRRPRLEHLEEQPGDVPVTYADTAKAERLLGYNPKVEFEEGVRRFVEWYENARQRGIL